LPVKWLLQESIERPGLATAPWLSAPLIAISIDEVIARKLHT
jgi:hypothetical protein